MSNKKFDFFGSPQPRAFDVVKYHPEAEDHENLFSTPAIYRSQQSPLTIDPFFSCSHRKDRRKLSGQLLVGAEPFSPSHESLSQQPSEGIYQRLDYSEEEEEKEELLVPITPQKAEKLLERIEEEEDPTIRKQAVLQATPITESRCYERGLKKLAFEAFKFVSSQKKTTYKEVARKLIKQLNDEQEIESHKKGEMNVKRRVYDALNVLIALGLLKRSGNKIVGKKCDSDSILYSDRYSEHEKTTSKIEMSCKKDELLQQELKNLKNNYKKRLDTIKEKQRLQKEFRHKLTSIKYLSERNQHSLARNPEKDQLRSRIDMPFILICRQQSASPIKQEADEDNVLLIEQQNDFALNTSFRSDSCIDIIGDLDIITSLDMQDYTTDEPEKRERAEKRRKPK